MKKRIHLILAVLLLASLWPMAQAQAAHQDGFTFFVPYSADELAQQFVEGQREINPTWSPNELVVTISIAILRDDTTVYYDHWEDGLEDNILQPQQGSTIVAAGLNSGEVFPLQNPVPIPRVPSDILFDGGDKIVAVGGAIAVTLAVWPEPLPPLLDGTVPPGILYAGAWELYPTVFWGTQYEIPVGVDLQAQRGGFTVVGLTVQAIDDGTSVTVVAGDGSPLASDTLAEGDSLTLIDGVTVGTQVSASEPVQVHIFTMNPCSIWEARAYTMLPTNLWGTQYLAPRSSDGDYWLYNPGGSLLTVTATTSAGPPGVDIPIPAGQTVQYLAGATTGVLFEASGTFYGLAALDLPQTPPNPIPPQCASVSIAQNQDWGYALLPIGALSTQALIGWAPGNAPGGDSTNPTGDESRVYVTAAQDTTVFAEVPGVGTFPFPVSAGQEVAIVNTPPFVDLTGTRLFTTDGVPFIAVWGQDESAPNADPSIDVGTNIVPLPAPSIEKTYFNCGAVANQGNIVRFQIDAFNDSEDAIDPAVIVDNLGAGVTYVPNSTFWTDVSGVTEQIPDDSPPATAFPLDEGGWTIPGGIPAFADGGRVTITFQARLPASGTYENTVGFLSPPAVQPATVDVDVPFGASSYQIAKTLVDPPAGTLVEPGDVISFTLAVANGITPIDQLPLLDEYDPNVLTFVDASLPPDAESPGRIAWFNAAPGGLAPGATLDPPITLSFQVNDPLPADQALTLNLILAAGLQDDVDGVVQLDQAVICDAEPVQFRPLQVDGERPPGERPPGIPEPATVTLFGLGLAGLAGYARARLRRKQDT